MSDYSSDDDFEVGGKIVHANGKYMRMAMEFRYMDLFVSCEQSRVLAECGASPTLDALREYVAKYGGLSVENSTCIKPLLVADRSHFALHHVIPSAEHSDAWEIILRGPKDEALERDALYSKTLGDPSRAFTPIAMLRLRIISNPGCDNAALGRALRLQDDGVVENGWPRVVVEKAFDVVRREQLYHCVGIRSHGADEFVVGDTKLYDRVGCCYLRAFSLRTRECMYEMLGEYPAFDKFFEMYVVSLMFGFSDVRGLSMTTLGETLHLTYADVAVSATVDTFSQHLVFTEDAMRVGADNGEKMRRVGYVSSDLNVVVVTPADAQMWSHDVVDGRIGSRYDAKAGSVYSDGRQDFQVGVRMKASHCTYKFPVGTYIRQGGVLIGSDEYGLHVVAPSGKPFNVSYPTVDPSKLDTSVCSQSSAWTKFSDVSLLQYEIGAAHCALSQAVGDRFLHRDVELSLYRVEDQLSGTDLRVKCVDIHDKLDSFRSCNEYRLDVRVPHYGRWYDVLLPPHLNQVKLYCVRGPGANVRFKNVILDEDGEIGVNLRGRRKVCVRVRPNAVGKRMSFRVVHVFDNEMYDYEHSEDECDLFRYVYPVM